MIIVFGNLTRFYVGVCGCQTISHVEMRGLLILVILRGLLILVIQNEGPPDFGNSVELFRDFGLSPILYMFTKS
jgi:hypothetical protein